MAARNGKHDYWFELSWGNFLLPHGFSVRVFSQSHETGETERQSYDTSVHWLMHCCICLSKRITKAHYFKAEAWLAKAQMMCVLVGLIVDQRAWASNAWAGLGHKMFHAQVELHNICLIS